MIVVLLVLFGVWMLAGPQLLERVRDIAATTVAAAPHLDRRHVAGAAILAAAAFAYAGGSRDSAPQPTPAPTPAPDARIVLRGKFSAHPEAALHAAQIKSLFGEIAHELEWDSMQDSPSWTTGQAMDDLRVRAFDMRLKGVSLGDIHPRVREAVKAHLDAVVGTSGGPLTPQKKAEWIAAYREIERAADEAAR